MDRTSKWFIGGLAALVAANIVVGICKTETVQKYISDLKKEYSPSTFVEKLFDYKK